MYLVRLVRTHIYDFQVCGRTSRGLTGFLHLPSGVLALIFRARILKLALT